ncbi:hypothetical protein [Actinocorallia populi]|uniref:hypothetical protein n=1 Tax=Actinocorallia populi TaxID=2079200 RepID=UPI000D08D274|nr:hypothetical protein [Actinocorallia populi]
MSGDLREGDEAALDSLVVLVAESLGYSCVRLPGDVMALEGPHRLHVGLRDLWQLARLMPRGDWPAVVSDHVTTVVTAVEEPLDLGDFALIRHLLRTRVQPAGADPGTLAARPFAPGLIEVVVVDTPTTVRTLTRAEVARWRVPDGELFALGRANVHADGLLQREERPARSPGEPAVTVLHDWTFYAATHVLWLEEYLRLGPLGALVALPSRGLVLALELRPARDGDALAEAAARLRATAERGFREGPGSLSRELYWWRQGELTPLERGEDGRAPVLPEGLLLAVAGERTAWD